MSLHNRMAAIVRKASVEEVDAAANKRWARRKSASTPAKILFDGITTPFDCTVRDISSTGALIEMNRTKLNPDGSTDALPHYFTLIIQLDRTAVECQSMWRRGTKVGAKFVGMVRTLSQPRATLRKPAAK
jgi:hypothetical protein